MSAKTEKAIQNHKNFYSCSASVLCAFCDEAGLTEKEAMAAAKPYAGGKMVKCGAVLAAEYVLKNKFGDNAQSKIDEFEKTFYQMNGSINCKELKGSLTGKVLRPCRGCVTDAAQILEKLIEN